MYKIENIKLEINFTPNEFICCGCLSSNRILRKLGDYLELFTKITGNVVDDVEDIFFCWECIAVLRKVNTFINNVAKAQRTLGCNYHSENPPQSLSKLSIQSLNYDEETPQTEIELKPLIELRVKQETEYDHGDYLNDRSSTDFGTESNNIDSIKQEVQDLVAPKKHKRKKYIQHVNKYTEILLPKRKCEIMRQEISHSEINYWLENERNNPYYKMAKYKCDNCAVVLKSRNRRTHFYTFHNQKKYSDPHKCDICQCFFSKKSTLSNHIQEHYYIYICRTCDVTSISMQSMRIHMRMACAKIYQCMECPGRFNVRRLFFSHYKEAHRHFICDYCNSLYKTKHMLIKHIAVNHSTYKCHICRITFKNYRYMQEHMKMQHVDAPTEANYCAPCDKQFANDILYRKHITRSVAHSHETPSGVKKKEKVQCPECSNFYHTKSGMRNHFRLVHLKQTNYYCNICERYFLNNTRLKGHQRKKHEGYVPAKDKLCNICGRGFSTNLILANHIRTHTGERPFHCTDCNSKFAQKVALDTHIKFIHRKQSRNAVHVEGDQTK